MDRLQSDTLPIDVIVCFDTSNGNRYGNESIGFDDHNVTCADSSIQYSVTIQPISFYPTTFLTPLYVANFNFSSYSCRTFNFINTYFTGFLQLDFGCGGDTPNAGIVFDNCEFDSVQAYPYVWWSSFHGFLWIFPQGGRWGEPSEYAYVIMRNTSMHDIDLVEMQIAVTTYVLFDSCRWERSTFGELDIAFISNERYKGAFIFHNNTISHCTFIWHFGIERLYDETPYHPSSYDTVGVRVTDSVFEYNQLNYTGLFMSIQDEYYGISFERCIWRSNWQYTNGNLSASGFGMVLLSDQGYGDTGMNQLTFRDNVFQCNQLLNSATNQVEGYVPPFSLDEFRLEPNASYPILPHVDGENNWIDPDCPCK